MNDARSAFTLVELLIIVAILSVLSSAAFVGIRRSQVAAMNNKVVADLAAIENALEQYRQDYGGYPLPVLSADKNILCFDSNLAYVHDCGGAIFMQAQIDNTVLTKRYLQQVPADPRTGSRYAYGITTDGKYYHVAGITQQGDGRFLAAAVDNLGSYPFLHSLIRAYNAQGFVADGQGYLPYSPNHRSITAQLQDIVEPAGDTDVIVTDADGDQVDDTETLYRGYTIDTTGGGTAVIYFSDGSVTYLDAGTVLKILPSTEVEENDEDGIITKIRLKLFSGKIWSKVVRLASASEFNIETTSAIAGVRGTEFGIDAAGTEFIVRSGSVAARQKTTQEQAVADSEGYVTFDAQSAFSATQVATGDGSFKHFTVPSATGEMQAGTPVSQSRETELEAAFYAHQLGLSPQDVPYVVQVLTDGNGGHTVSVAFNGFSSDDALDIDGFELLTRDQFSDPRLVAEGEVATITITDVAHDAGEQAYVFEIQYAGVGDPLHDAQAGRGQGISIRAYQDVAGARTYSAPSWPLLGFLSESSTVSHDFADPRFYEEFAGVAEPRPGDPDTEGGPMITGPSSVPVDGPAISLTSSEPCTWSLSGDGELIGSVAGTSTISYGPVEVSLTPRQRAADIATRFASANSQTVIVTCQASSAATHEITVNYQPWSTSGISGYRYSHFAQGSINWTDAITACNNLTEGGVSERTWSLPSKSVYDPLDGTEDNDTTDLAEAAFWCGTFGSSCSDMPGTVAAIWLLEENELNTDNGWRIVGNQIAFDGSSPKRTTESWLGLRCVR